MKIIQSIEDLQKMLLNNSNIEWPNTVMVKEKGDLLLFKYTRQCQYGNLWTPLELMSRGLILNKKTGEVVARPFDKFFNWMENGRYTTSPIKRVIEKYDGSLGILYRDNGKYKIATSGSFDSKMALWATDYLNKTYPNLTIPDEWTVLYEIIYPENRIVVNYGDLEGLALLNIRNRFTGEYLDWNTVRYFGLMTGCIEPMQYYDFRTISGLLNQVETIDENQEGYIVYFEDGSIFKFKGKKYLKIASLLSHLTFNKVLEFWLQNKVDSILEELPDEFYPQIKTYVESIELTIDLIKDHVEKLYSLSPKTSKKEYVAWCKDFVPKKYFHYLMSRYNNEPLLDLICKQEFGYEIQTLRRKEGK